MILVEPIRVAFPAGPTRLETRRAPERHESAIGSADAKGPPVAGMDCRGIVARGQRP
jgi:hypothetical protein